MSAILEVDRLTKCFRSQWTFRAIRALDDVTFALREGEVFGLIGHNGAGKTTTFKLLLGFLRPTRGRATLLGQPCGAPSARRQIGFLPEQPYFYDHLSVRETLEFYARLCGLQAADYRPRIQALVERLRLGPKLQASMRSLSKGTLQRVGIAQAIVHRPRLVILDEPMSGLDPAGRKEMRELIRSLRDDGATVIFSSHILPDAEALCDRVGMLIRGRLQDIVDLHHFERTSAAFQLTVSGLPDGAGTLDWLRRLAIETASTGPTAWTLTIGDRSQLPEALRRVHEAGGRVEALTPKVPSLEERFLSFVQESDAAP